MINFTVGPVQVSDKIRELGKQQIPYFRTKEFSEIILNNEKLIKKFLKATDNSRVVFVTGSGTASMEASVINTLTIKDKVLIINGGSFGQRFVNLCKIYGIPYQEVLLEPGKTLTEENLVFYEEQGFTALLVNLHETSTGVLYDMNIISKFCIRNNLFLIVDAISSFLADEFDMTKTKSDVVIIGSQKALACPPGISIIALSERAIKRVNNSITRCMYLDLKEALKDGERGQTPFTPAVGTLLQINARLEEIEAKGGVKSQIEQISRQANDFRKKILELPFQIFSNLLSNAVTPLCSCTVSAYDIFLILKDEYSIWVCPNGGNLKDKVFRVGHIGELTPEDNDILIAALKDLQRKKLFNEAL